MGEDEEDLALVDAVFDTRKTRDVFYLTAEGALDQTHEHLEFGNDVKRLFFPQLVKRVPQFRPGDESGM